MNEKRLEEITARVDETIERLEELLDEKNYGVEAEVLIANGETLAWRRTKDGWQLLLEIWIHPADRNGASRNQHRLLNVSRVRKVRALRASGSLLEAIQDEANALLMHAEDAVKFAEDLIAKNSTGAGTAVT